MPEIEVLSSFLLTALVLELTPGPNMAWLALLAATTGRGAGSEKTMPGRASPNRNTNVVGWCRSTSASDMTAVTSTRAS